MESAIANTTASNGVAISVVAIVLSAGGLKGLREVVGGLRADLPAAVLVAQHIHETTLLPEILASDTTMPVLLAGHGALLRPGRVYVCPAAHHVVVNPNATLTVSSGPRVRFFRPSGDWLFESASASFGARTVAIVLSGAQDDGARGAVAVRKAGGTVIVQDPATCAYPEMPSAAITTGAVGHVLAPDQIARCVNTLMSRPLSNDGRWTAAQAM